jgi:8-oxo-dGTP diphosphatase
MIEYAVGFLFDPLMHYVALIEKKRPDWQAGRLNGVGGHIEDNESPDQAMSREFLEETGLTITRWNLLAKLFVSETDALCWCYWAVDWNIDDCQSVTDEKVLIVPARELPDNTITNLRWLIPLAIHEGGITDVPEIYMKEKP